MTPTTRDMEEAREIVEHSPECSECKAITVRSGDMVKCLNCGHERNWFVSQQHRIAQALAARNPPPGHVRLSDGRVCKVLGSLPMTADGCVAGLGAHVSWCEYGESYVYNGSVHFRPVWAASIPIDSYVPIRECYSTEAAALAAKEKQ